MKKIQRSIIFVIGILLWVMQGQSVFAAGSTELLSGTIANTTISYRLTEDGTLTIYSDNIEEMPNYTVNSTVPWAAQKDKIKKVQINSYLKNIGDRVGVYTILFVELFMHPIHIFLYDVGV